jgi:hypothetical protein
MTAGTPAAGMAVVRLYEPARRPANWTEIIRPGQFAVFARDDESGVPCGIDGVRFADTALATCALFGSIDSARGFCEAAVLRHPTIRFDIFDHEGRVRPALLTVVHPDRAARLETSPRQIRVRRWLAWALVGGGVPLIVYARVADREHDVILPAFLGINLIIVAGRLLFMNFAVRETELARERRLEQSRSRPSPPG